MKLKKKIENIVDHTDDEEKSSNDESSSSAYSQRKSTRISNIRQQKSPSPAKRFESWVVAMSKDFDVEVKILKNRNNNNTKIYTFKIVLAQNSI